MYFETIHNVPHFDDVTFAEEGGYTSYWETDTEVDSDFGNFIFNNVAGDSASVICIDDTIDVMALRKRNEELKIRPHYRLEHQDRSLPSSPTAAAENPLERSIESKRSMNSQQSKRSHSSGSDGMMYNTPPPVPPPRRPSRTATDFQDHTYETLDDCKEEYLAQQDTIYISKASEDSRGSQDSTAKPVSNDEAESDRSSTCKRAEGAGLKSPTCRGKSQSLSLSKSPESLVYRQHRKLSEPITNGYRKRRSEKVASKGNYPPPAKGFPAGVPEDYVDYLPSSNACLSPERRSQTTVSPASSPGQRANLERRHSSTQGKKTAPLIIKHKGKTYVVPVVDKKLQKELEKRSKRENPTVTIKLGTINPGVVRSYSSAFSNATNHISSNLTNRSHASPPKMEPCDHAAPHRRRNNSKSSTQNSSKQVTHYGVL